MPTRPIPARMAVVPAAAPAPRPCDVPELIPACWRQQWNAEPETRPCAACGGEAVWLGPDPNEDCGLDYYLCTDPECAATNEDGVVVDIAPAAWAGTDTPRDVAHEMERERPSALERAETRADDRATGGRKLDYLY